tara:strand:- start:45 stop:656 length:612 start_codon:yes stop_codon:yes gene_type:complete
MSSTKSIFKTLSEVSVKSKVERKGNLDYLSWANAWSMLKQYYPSSQRIVYEDPSTGLNFFTDGRTAYVKVGIIVEALEHIDYLPVMDYRNNAVPIEKVTSFEVNKTIQRSTAKAIALHGLGLSLWSGEDIPVTTETKKEDSKLKVITLDVDDDNYNNLVIPFIQKNVELGLEEIVKRLKTKYKIKSSVVKDLDSKLEEFLNDK